MTTVAALFVATGGVYFNLPDVDPWDEKRDARLYAGPCPVVAHPPCGTWGAYARLGWTKRTLGDDDGCFASALESVRRFGGVLEHPAMSSAWGAHRLIRPPAHGGWVYAGEGGWTCQVEQGHYGHRAKKPTWLYAHGVELPSLRWGASSATEECQRLSSKQRAASPVEFRDLLLSIARSAYSIKEENPVEPIILWSDAGEPEHRAELLKTAAGIRLRIVRIDSDGRRVSHYVALSSEECDGLARALVHREEAA